MILALALTSCRSASPRPDAVLIGLGEVLVVDDGDSSQPNLSADGNRLAFVSQKRSAHVSTQIYIRDLVKNTERRVTFQNGVVMRPRFHPRENLIAYASSTDEDKEHPARLREARRATMVPAWLRQPSEIYEHNLESYDIKRLVTREGFDGDAHFAANGHALTWTSVRDDQTSITWYNRETGAVTEIKHFGLNPAELTLAADQRTAAWVNYDPTFDHVRLMLRQAEKVAEVAPDHRGLKVDPTFSPEGFFLFWAEYDQARNAYVLFARDLLKDCVRPVPFQSPGSRRHPALSPDGTTLYYSLIKDDRSRIASTTFDRALCP